MMAPSDCASAGSTQQGHEALGRQVRPNDQCSQSGQCLPASHQQAVRNGIGANPRTLALDCVSKCYSLAATSMASSTHSRLNVMSSMPGAAALPGAAPGDGMPLLMLPEMAPDRLPVMAPLMLPEPGPARPMPLGLPLPPASLAMACTDTVDDRCQDEAGARRCAASRGTHGDGSAAAALAMLLLQHRPPAGIGRVVMA